LENFWGYLATGYFDFFCKVNSIGGCFTDFGLTMYSTTDGSFHQGAMDLMFCFDQVLEYWFIGLLQGLDLLWTHMEAYVIGYFSGAMVGDLSSSVATGSRGLLEVCTSDPLQEVPTSFLGLNAVILLVSSLWDWDVAHQIQASFEAYFGLFCWHSWSGCWLFGLGFGFEQLSRFYVVMEQIEEQIVFGIIYKEVLCSVSFNLFNL